MTTHPNRDDSHIDAELDRLLSDRGPTPSADFQDRVLAAVRAEEDTAKVVAFPWLPAIGAIAAALLLTFVGLSQWSQSGPTAPNEGAIAGDTHFAPASAITTPTTQPVALVDEILLLAELLPDSSIDVSSTPTGLDETLTWIEGSQYL